MPVIAGAKARGAVAAALTQMKQLGQASSLYANDADGAVAPSTNWGAKESKPSRLWQPLLQTYAKNEEIFVAPGSGGAYAATWGRRAEATVGMNSATAFKADGCEAGKRDSTGCLGFTTAADLDKAEEVSQIPLFSVTPGGDDAAHYGGWEFSPYNGDAVPGADPKFWPPLCADRDLVAEMKPLPAALLKPVFARYGADKLGHGVTPLVFADGRAKTYSAREIVGGRQIVWRFR